MEFCISTTWNGAKVDHPSVTVRLSPHPKGCLMSVSAPFFNDPPAPPGQAGMAVPGLWDYEVVEAFFLNDQDEYLEVELCPHGHHLLLLLKGCRNIVQDELEVEFKATIDGSSWSGEVILPNCYFPQNVTRFNAYAIHGSGENRTYEALYPTSGDFSEPDFHRLQFFKQIDMSSILKNNTSDYKSEIWSKYCNKS